MVLLVVLYSCIDEVRLPSLGLCLSSVTCEGVGPSHALGPSYNFGPSNALGPIHALSPSQVLVTPLVLVTVLSCHDMSRAWHMQRSKSVIKRQLEEEKEQRTSREAKKLRVEMRKRGHQVSSFPSVCL